jgi:hypothetical protein
VCEINLPHATGSKFFINLKAVVNSGPHKIIWRPTCLDDWNVQNTRACGSLEQRVNVTYALRIAGALLRDECSALGVRQFQGLKIDILNANPIGRRHSTVS